MQAKLFLLVLLHVLKTHASPFLLTDHYLQTFAEGIHELKKLADEAREDGGHDDLDKHNGTHTEEYDFVIVGAGTSGSVLANRLSEVPEWKVLLLEAGDLETPYTQVPALAPYLQRTKYNWRYKSVPQKTWCLGMKDKRCGCSAGKSLGGSSAINSMLYTRGNKRDYDIWADHGNDGWCYEDVLPYFKKSENAHLEHFDKKYHNQGGPIHVENPKHVTHLLDGFHTNNLDYNGKEQLGYSSLQVTTSQGKRHSTAQGYLMPVKDRHNLEISPLSQVIEVIINPHTKEAVGVKYLHEGHLHVAKAKKEVVLAAGAYNTPQLLMLSGLGPKEELHKHDIPLVHELNVGKHLKNRVSFMGLHYIMNSTHHHESNDVEDLTQYLKNGKGPLAKAVAEVVGFIKTKASKDKAHYPDIQLLLSPKLHYNAKNDRLNWRISDEMYANALKPLEGHDLIQIVVTLTHPKSTGSVTLHSKDPLDRPLIDLNQFSDADDEDINTMVEGIKEAIALIDSEAFHKVEGHLYEEPLIGCEDHEFDTNDYWKCAVRHISTSHDDQSGTCRMGPDSDKDAVVDNKLNVYGVHKLRVADASVIPVSITGHIQAPTIMIGEKAADLIKDYWH